MSNDFWSTLNKKKKEELLKSGQTKASSSASKTSEELKSSDFWSVLSEENRQKLSSSGTTIDAPMRTVMSDDDIAPVKGGNKDSIFKSGGFSDGVDGVGDFFGDLGQTVLGTTADLGIGILKGAGRLVEGVADLGTYGVAGVADLFGADEFAEKTKKVARYNATDEWTKGATDYVDQYSVLGNKADMVSEGIGQVASIIATGGLGAAGGLSSAGATALTTGLTFASGMGSGMNEAYESGASDGKAFAYGVTSGTVEAISELIFGGLGKGVKALGVSKGLTSIDDVVAKKISNAAAKYITSEAGQKVVGNTLEYAVKSGAEGLEEVISGFGSAIAKDVYLMNGKDEKAFLEILKDEKLLEQFVVGSIVSGIAQGGDFIKSTKNGRDFVSGLSNNEQTVVDKVYEQRLAEESKNKTLSNKDKNKLYESIVEQMEKGYISTDTIEEVLGGDEYKTYKDNLDTTSKLKTELEDLSSIEKGKLTRKQEKRIEELEAMNLNDTTKSDELRKKLDDKLSPMLNGSKLAESYRETERRKQAFTADLTKYTGKQKEAIQRAIDSGVLNNTNRSHELVDTLSRIEADKGIVFDYTNNKKLKESGFAIEGKTVNGFVKNGGVTLNVQSQKAWQSTVGHEITHVLEGTESYGALREALFAYAESKGELESRRTSLAEAYNGIDADIDAELTADLVGDYLFTDKDFINHLMGNRTLFQKVYDEIKYLCKVATGKELTEIEKVKREFDRAWKEQGQIAQNNEFDTEFDNDDVNYSLSKSDSDFSKMFEMRKEEGKLNRAIEEIENDGEFKKKLNEIFSSNDTETAIKEYQRLLEESDYGKLKKQRDALRTEIENFNKSLEKERDDNALKEEKENVAKSGLSEADYFRKQAVKNFGYTPYFYDAGYITPNGKMLNFSGEKGNHFGSRGQDHRAIGIIYANTQGTDALNRFIKDGNIRIMAESPAIDLSTGVEPTTEQYSTIRRFINEYADKGYFCVDLTDESGKVIGSLEYENRINPTRILNDIKHYYATGEIREQSSIDKFRYSLSVDSKGNELSLAVQKRFANSKVVDENGNLKVLYHGTANGEFYTFDKAKGSVEGDFGSGFYFTDNESDVERNYEGGGPDFDNKVARRAEQIEAEEDIEYSEAEARAREELYVGSNKFEVYLNIEKPAIVGETTLFGYESYAEEYDRNDYDSDEDYEGDVELLIADDIDQIVWDIERNIDIYSTDGIAEVLWNAVNEGGIGIEQLKAQINELYLEDNNGNFVGNEVTRQIIESLGYDGIIDNTVSSKFNMGLSEDTTHYIVFKPNQIKDISNQNPTDNPDIRYSLSKDIENFDNSWYNEIELPATERDRVQSEALTWHTENKGHPFSMPLSNGFTYLCSLDNDGIVHIYGKEKSVNIHEFGGNYDNRNTERPDRYVEKFGNQQGIDIVDNVFDENGQDQIAPIASNGTTVQGEGRSNGTGYSKNDTYAYRKPKAIGWHFNDDGSVEVTYSDGTKEIEYPTPKKGASSSGGVFFDGKNSKRSLSNEGEQFAPIGNYSTPLNETALEQDIAPIADVAENATTTTEAPMPKDTNATPKSTQLADGTRGDELLVESLDNYPMETVEQKVAENIRAIEGELADNRDIRREAEANYNSQIAKLQKEYNSKKNKETKVAYELLQSISRLERLKASTDAKFAKRISDLEARLEKMNDPQYSRAMYKKSKMEEYAKFAEDLIGDTSTWVDKKIGLKYAINTERRNLRDIVRDENGNADIAKADAINDALNGQYNRNQAERNRKDNEISKKYLDLKVNRHESVYANMLGELRSNPETTLTEKVVNEYYEKHKNKIDTKKVDKLISYVRSDLDYFFETLNTKLREQGMKEIPYRKGYFPHKVEPKQNFIQKLFNWKTQDNEIPTSIAGLTEDFKPVKSYQSFDKQRHTDETDYDIMRLFQNYKNGALDWIYHLEDIQKRRAVENYVRYTHSEEGIQARIKAVYANEEYDADEAQAQIEHILAEAKNPLNNFVQDFTTHTNILAGKKNSLDRTTEQMTNRQIYSVMQNVQNRTSANLVLANVRSALTNFIPITQSWAQVSPLQSIQAAKDTIANAIKDDGLINKSTFLTNRLREADSLYKTNWDVVLDKAGIMFEIVDNFSSQVIWRSKYNQNLDNGMSEAEAIANADQFAENVMAGRSKGNEPTLFNAKNPLVKAFTMFQLEVNNTYGYFFKDVPNDLKAETEHWKLNLAKGYTTAFIGAYVYNALLEQVAGSGAAFDPIGIIEDLLRDLGLFDDDEEKETAEIITNLMENVGGELPFVGGTLFGGGRIPVSSALPYGDNGLVEGVGDFVTDVTEGNWKNIGKEMMNPILNVGFPVAGGQIKKTVQGLKMFSDDHPVTGSYTDSGSLRFPVEDTLGNRIQAAIFGQYASKNAREYFDNDYAPLKQGKQIKEYMDVDMPIADYWKYREGLSGLKTNEEKADYINSLDIKTWQKNLLLNNILDRKEDVDMSNYDDFADFEEFDYAQKNPEKYAFAKSVGGYSSYKTYSDALYSIKADKDESGKSITGSRKEKVLNFINNLDADYETKIILWKSEYPSDDTYNMDIINYINNRTDLTYEERVSIFTELGFTVSNGSVYWD